VKVFIKLVPQSDGDVLLLVCLIISSSAGNAYWSGTGLTARQPNSVDGSEWRGADEPLKPEAGRGAIASAILTCLLLFLTPSVVKIPRVKTKLNIIIIIIIIIIYIIILKLIAQVPVSQSVDRRVFWCSLPAAPSVKGR